MNRYWNGILFTVLWTLGMMAWSWPLTMAHAIILVVCGAVAGVAFHVVMQRMAQRQGRGS